MDSLRVSGALSPTDCVLRRPSPLGDLGRVETLVDRPPERLGLNMSLPVAANQFPNVLAIVCVVAGRDLRLDLLILSICQRDYLTNCSDAGSTAQCNILSPFGSRRMSPLTDRRIAGYHQWTYRPQFLLRNISAREGAW